MDNHTHTLHFPLELTIIFLLFLSLISYIFAASVAKTIQWPVYRQVFWILGIFCIASSLVGPIADHAHNHFVWHMLGHLLLGMLAPLLIVLSAPMTLLLRTLNVVYARRLSKIMKSKTVGFISNPFVASILNIGGLWALYTSYLFEEMHHTIFLHLFIHLHIFLAGYLFTASIITIDPTPHRYSFLYRSIVFVVALAGHDILSKFIFAHPPINVPITEAQNGAMLMYYGGDAIDIVLISIMCYQWFKSAQPRLTEKTPVNT